MWRKDNGATFIHTNEEVKMTSRYREKDSVIDQMETTVDEMTDRDAGGTLWLLAVLIDIATSLRLIQKSLVREKKR